MDSLTIASGVGAMAVHGRAKSALAGCLLLLALVLTLPASAHAAAGDTYPNGIGVGTHLRYFDLKDIRSEMGRLHKGGVTWVREDFSWSQLEPFPGVEDWSGTDKLMTAAALEDI